MSGGPFCGACGVAKGLHKLHHLASGRLCPDGSGHVYRDPPRPPDARVHAAEVELERALMRMGPDRRRVADLCRALLRRLPLGERKGAVREAAEEVIGGGG